jgi:hypothetical protein
MELLFFPGFTAMIQEFIVTFFFLAAVSQSLGWLLKINLRQENKTTRSFESIARSLDHEFAKPKN